MKCPKIVKNAKAAIGIVVTILVFLIVLAATTVIFVQYNAFIQDMNRAAERSTARANEKIIIRTITCGQQIDPNAILIENVGKGPGTSEIMAILRRDVITLRTENYTLSQPATVKLTESIRISVKDMFTITEKDQVGVLTSLGNVFWGFTVKITFTAVKTLDPALPENTTMNPNATILNVDGVDYTVEELLPENETGGIFFLWPAGSQHQFAWANHVEALAQLNIMTRWNYNGTKGLIQLPADKNYAMFQAPYIDHYIMADYFAELRGTLTMNATWTDTGTKENTGVEAANNRNYELQINTTLTLGQDLLDKYAVRNVTLAFGNIENRDNATAGQPRTKPNAEFPNSQTTTTIQFVDNETTQLTYATVTSGTFWWNETYNGKWTIPVTATLILSEGSLTVEDTVTLTLEPLNKTKVTFWWIGEKDNENLGTIPVSYNSLNVNITGTSDPIPDLPRSGYYQFDSLPQLTIHQISVVPGVYEIQCSDAQLDANYGVPREFQFWTINDTDGLEKDVSANQPLNWPFGGPEAAVFAVYEDLKTAGFKLKLDTTPTGGDLQGYHLTVYAANVSGYVFGGSTTVYANTGSYTTLNGKVVKTGVVKVSASITERVGNYLFESWNVYLYDESGNAAFYWDQGDLSSASFQINITVNYLTDNSIIKIDLHVYYVYSPPNYNVTFTVSGMDSTATEPVLTVEGSLYSYSDLPLTFNWVNGTICYYSYEATVSSSTSGKQFTLKSVVGPASPITVTSSATVTGYYNKADLPPPPPDRYKLSTYVLRTGVGTTSYSPGSITLSPAPGADGKYDSGTKVTATASPAIGCEFVNWRFNSVDYTGSSLTITVSSDSELKAYFKVKNMGEITIKTGFRVPFVGLCVQDLGIIRSYLGSMGYSDVEAGLTSISFSQAKIGYNGYNEYGSSGNWWTTDIGWSLDGGITDPWKAGTTIPFNIPDESFYLEARRGYYRNSIIQIVHFYNMRFELTGGRWIDNVPWSDSTSWYTVIYVDINSNYNSLSPLSWYGADPLLQFFAAGEGLEPLPCNVAGFNVYSEHVEAFNVCNISLFEGVYNVSAPAIWSGKTFSHWVDAKTNKTLGTSTTLTINLTEATTVIAVYMTLEQVNAQAAIALVLTFATGFAMVLTFRKRRRTKKALSSTLAAIIFFVVVVPMIISIIVFVPRLNQAIKISSDVQQLLTEKAKENLEAYVYLFDSATGTIVIQAANTGSVEITITHGLVINYLNQPPAKTYQLQTANSSMAVGSIHFFLIGPATPEQLGLNPAIPTSQNTAPMTAYETISLVSKRGNLFSTTPTP